MRPGSKRTAGPHEEGDRRGRKRCKDVLAELQGSPEYRAKKVQSDSLSSMMWLTSFKAKLGQWFFLAMTVLSMFGFSVLGIPGAVFGLVCRINLGQEIERLKAELDKIENDDDGIILRVKMLTIFLSSPAEFFAHPLIKDRHLETHFFGGRENFLANLRDLIKDDVRLFLADDMQETIKRLLRDYGAEILVAFNDALASNLEDGGYDLEDLVAFLEGWQYPTLMQRPRLVSAFDKGICNAIEFAGLNVTPIACLVEVDKALGATGFKMIQTAFPAAKAKYAELERDFVAELKEEGDNATTLTALLKEYGRDVFVPRINKDGVAPATRALFKHDLRSTPLERITTSDGWQFHKDFPGLKLLEPHVETYIVNNTSRLKEIEALLTKQFQAASRAERAIIDEIKQGCQQRLKQDLRILEEDHNMAINKPTARKKEIQQEIDKYSINPRFHRKMKSLRAELEEVEEELCQLAVRYENRQKHAMNRSNDDERDKIQQRLDRQKDQTKHAESEAEKDARRVKDRWEDYKAVHLR